jgi:hypothetical protein
MYSFPEKLKITPSDRFFFTCPSHGFIPPVLSLIDKIISHDPEINIIVMNEQMRLFWRQLVRKQGVHWNVILLNTASPGRYRNILSWLKIKPLIMKLFEDHFKSVKNAHFYCCGHASDFVLFSLVKLIAKENTVVFLNIDYGETQKIYTLRALILLLHTRVFYGIDVKARRFPFSDEPLIFLSDRYFRKLDIELHQFEYYYDAGLLKKYNPIPDRYISGKRIIWLGDDCSFYDGEMEDQILDLLKAIKNIVAGNFAESEVICKPHPNPSFRSEASTSVCSGYEELPSFMNADFMLPSPDIRFVLGGISAVLSTAAKNSPVMAISYVKLMPFKDRKVKSLMVEFWMALADQKIIYVESLDELNLLFKEQKDVNPRKKPVCS